VERAFTLSRRYDAILLLHVLEHLDNPEAAVHRLVGGLSAGGALIGGSPTMPSLLAVGHEPWLCWKYRNVPVTEHRHLSVITPRRIKRFARQHHLDVDLLAGAFFCRWTGVFLEDFEWWARVNLAWGAMFPSLGGEVYFSLTRTGTPGLSDV